MFCELALTCALSLSHAQGANADPTLQRLRTPDPVIRAAIEDGRRRSPTVASLVDTIERSDTFVYVTRAFMLPHRMEGCLVPSRSRTGHLRVRLAMSLGKDETIIVLAHELQHVREVLDAGGGHDQAALDSLFIRIGIRRLGTPTERYETAAAHEVMTIVAREMREVVAR
jgi:hypothetical protein